MKTSPLWKYFIIADSDETCAICTFCGGKFSYKTSTTNLKKHLGKKHRDANASLDFVSTVKLNTSDSKDKKRTKPKSKPRLSSHLSPFGSPKKDHNEHNCSDESEQETNEEMEIVMKTKSGINMTYTARKKEVTLDLRDNVLQQVQLISKEEVVTLMNEGGKYHIEAKKNVRENKEVMKSYENGIANKRVTVLQPATINSEEVVYSNSDDVSQIRIVEGTVRTAQIEEVIELCGDEIM